MGICLILQILAPTIADAYCQETLTSSVDDLSKLCEGLKGIWKPIVQAPQLRQTGEKLEENLNHVHATLDKLRKACQNTGMELSKLFILILDNNVKPIQ